MLASVIPAPASAAGDLAPADFPFKMSTSDCRDVLADTPRDCHVNATGVVHFLGCAQYECSFWVEAKAQSDGLQAGLPKLHVTVRTIIVDWSGGGTTELAVCKDEDVLRTLRCQGDSRWSTVIFGGDCIHVIVQAQRTNVPESSGLFGRRIGLVEDATAALRWDLCRSAVGNTLTFGPFVVPPPPPPPRLAIHLDVPSGKVPVLRLNFSGPTDLTFSYRLGMSEESSEPGRTQKMFYTGAYNGTPHIWLSFTHSGDSSGIEPDPLVSVGIDGNRVGAALPPQTFSSGESWLGGTHYFANYAYLPASLVVSPGAIGGPSTFEATFDWTAGDFEYDIAYADLIAYTKEELHGGVHASAKVPVVSGIGASVGALGSLELEPRHDAIAAWVAAHRFNELSATSSTCTEGDAPCSDDWMGISVLSTHGPERWAFTLDSEVAVESERYVLYGVSMPDDSYYGAID